MRARGVEIDVSTLAGWVGASVATLDPILEAIRRHIFAAERLHVDDTTVPVLAKLKTVTGRIWTYVRDDRPFGGSDPPAALFYYSRTRAGQYPRAHLAGWTGINTPTPLRDSTNSITRDDNLHRSLKLHAGVMESESFSIWRSWRKRRLPAKACGALPNSSRSSAQEQRLAVRREQSKPCVLALEAWLRNSAIASPRRAKSPRPSRLSIAFVAILNELGKDAQIRSLEPVALRDRIHARYYEDRRFIQIGKCSKYQFPTAPQIYSPILWAQIFLCQPRDRR
jgi:Transposase IS66 family